MGMIRNAAAIVVLCAGLGAGGNAQAFQAPEVRQPAQKSNFLHRVRSVDPIMASFLSGRPFFVTVESDFSAEQNGIDRKMAEQQIANKVYDFLAPIIERHSRKPAVFLRPEPKQGIDFPVGTGVVNVRVYVHSNVVLSEAPYYQTSLGFRLFWMVGWQDNLLTESEDFMPFSEEEKPPPYYYQCSSMNDCYRDVLHKNLDDGLRHYFNDFVEN